MAHPGGKEAENSSFSASSQPHGKILQRVVAANPYHLVTWYCAFRGRTGAGVSGCASDQISTELK